MNRSLFFCALLGNFSIQCMEQNNQIVQKDNPWKKIDCSAITKTLEKDGITYLENRLEEYKKADFDPHHMDHIKSRYVHITGKPNNFMCGYEVKDKEKNSFLHIAVQKPDLAIVTWLMNNQGWTSNSNIQNKNPFDICTEQLLPTANEKNKTVMYDILDILIAGYNGYPTSYREKLLTKLITLEFEHKKIQKVFEFKESWLQALVTNDKDSLDLNCGCSACISLSDIYPTITDADKNTFTHILVQKHCADQLYDFITKGYVSFAPNNANKNSLELAIEVFNDCFEKGALFTSSARCCLFMLLNYVKKQQNIAFEQCCKNHTI